MEPLQIESLRADHVKDFLAWGVHQDPLFSMYNFEEEEDCLQDWYQWKTSGKNDHYFAILREGFALGYMGLKGHNRVLGSAQLGVILDANHMGQGIGTWALKWLLDYGFDHLDLSRVDLEVLPWNKRAFCLYEKLGFLPKSRPWRNLDLEASLIKGPLLDPYRDRLVKFSGQYYIQVDRMTITREGWRCRDEI